MTSDDINTGPPPFAPPPWVSVSPFPHPSPRRLSSHFTPPTRPVRAAKQLAWVSLQGRIVGAEEASSATAIGGGLSLEEAVSWELFSPMHRILIVAVIAVAAANSKKNKLIVQLKKSVEIRDRVLLGMQEKLDNLCVQVNYFKDKPDISSYEFEFSGGRCQHCNLHQLPSQYKEVDITRKSVYDDDVIESKMVNDAEQEERRMSDLSDWAPSVGSSVDVQCNMNIPVEHDIGKLQKECEEKNAIIKELSDFLNSAESHKSKRIAELEDVIRRKNMLITKLRKDMMVLEQKVIHLTRLRRPSSSKSNSTSNKFPAMSDNLIYDMDSTTSPSDDSDSSAKKKHRVPAIPVVNTRKPTHPDAAKLMTKSIEQPLRPASPLKERSLNQNANWVNLSKSKESKSVSGGYKSKSGASSKSTISREPRERKRWS